MPWRPRRTCARHGITVPPSGCQRCAVEYDRRRPEHFAFYASNAWKAVRARVLADEPRCWHCGDPSTDVDHVISRRLRPDLAFSRENLRALCHACHARKTRQES